VNSFLKPYLEPIAKLREALECRGLKEDDFVVLKHGETRTIIQEGDKNDDVEDSS